MSSSLAGQFIAVPLFNQLVPDQGPRGIAKTYDFNGVDAFDFDGYPTKEAGRMQGIQSIYYDNAYMDEDVIFTDDITAQVMVLPGRTQGYRNVLVNQQLQFRFSSAGSSIFSFIGLNVPMFPSEWPASITL